MKALVLPPLNATLTVLGLQHLAPVAAPVEARGRVAIVAERDRSWHDEVERLNAEWLCVDAPVQLDLDEPHLIVRDDTIETVFEPGAWTSTNTFWVPVEEGAVIGSAEIVDCLPIVGHYDAGDPECLVHHGGGTLDHVIPSDAPDGMYLIRDVDDQTAYADFFKSEWAIVLGDIATCVRRCPWCWGGGTEPIDEPDGSGGQALCRLCHGKGSRPPINYHATTGDHPVVEWSPREA